MNVKRNSLLSIIGRDLYRRNKFAVLLLSFCIATALIVVSVTDKFRILVDKREQLILEQDRLNSEWRHLILEEEVWGKQNRIAQVASEKMGMFFVKMENETIVYEAENKKKRASK